ncbi:MAG: hypothetical protein FIA94_11220 [Nitrospirae bacterium]|nr:hypothetical protein [Nitrospirota bacterium]
MRTFRIFVILGACVTLLAVSVSAEVKITLKNGRSFIVDACREAKGKFVCELQGGTMELDRGDIASLKDVKVQRSMPGEEASEPAGQSQENKGQDKPAPEMKAAPGQNGEGKLVRGLTPEQTKRLDEINERKTVLKPEREKLIRERDQLHADVKNAGVVRTQEQIDAIAQRVRELEARINGFNDEVKRLNDEENALIAGSGAK